jgi:cytosine deaminase
MTGTLFLRNVRPYAGDATDLLIEDGRIARIALGLNAPPGTTVE